MEGVKFVFYHSLKWGLLCDSDNVRVLEDCRGSGDWCEAGGDHGGRHHLGGHGPGGGLPEPARHPARQPLPRPRLRPVAEQQAGPVHRQPGEAEAPHALLHPALGGGVQQHRARAGAARAQQVEVRTVGGFQLLGRLQNIVMVHPIGNIKKWHTSFLELTNLIKPSFPAFPLVVPRQQKAESTLMKLSEWSASFSKSTTPCSTLSHPDSDGSSMVLLPSKIILNGIVYSFYSSRLQDVMGFCYYLL